MLPINTMTTVATKLAVQMADEIFMQKGAELDAAIKMAAKMYIQKCDDLDKHLEDSFAAAFDGEKISKERITRIAGKFCDILLADKVAIIDETLQI